MATNVTIMPPTAHKDLSRRAVLASLPLAFAPAAHMLPNIYAEVTAAEPPSHPVLALPFVSDRRGDERASGADPRSFWSVTPSGFYAADCATGAEYAALAADYMIAARSPHMLAWVVSDMMALPRRHSGIEVGFLSTFGRLATQAHALETRTAGGTA